MSPQSADMDGLWGGAPGETDPFTPFTHQGPIRLAARQIVHDTCRRQLAALGQSPTGVRRAKCIRQCVTWFISSRRKGRIVSRTLFSVR